MTPYGRAATLHRQRDRPCRHAVTANRVSVRRRQEAREYPFPTPHHGRDQGANASSKPNRRRRLPPFAMQRTQCQSPRRSPGWSSGPHPLDAHCGCPKPPVDQRVVRPDGFVARRRVDRHRALTVVSMLAPAAVAIAAVAVALRRICDSAAYVLLRASWTAVPSAPAPSAAIGGRVCSPFRVRSKCHIGVEGFTNGVANAAISGSSDPSVGWVLM